MVSIDEAQEILDQVAEGLPKEFYKELNGGIYLKPEVRMSREPWAKNLYTLGEYNYSHSMGRYIDIFYGSFQYVFGEHTSRETIAEELRNTLLHEFRHHLEDLAGENALEKEDEEFLRLHRMTYANRSRRIHNLKERRSRRGAQPEHFCAKLLRRIAGLFR